MSVILDALKKLDREKLVRRSGAPNIAVEILRPDLPSPGRRILPYFAAVFLITAALTYAVIVQFGFLSKSSPPAPVNPLAPIQQVSPAPPEHGLVSKESPVAPVNPPVSSQQILPAPPSREPVRDARDEISRVPPKIQNQAESKTPATFLDEKKTSSNVIPEEAPVAPGIRKKTAEVAPNESVKTPRSLKISGIVWSEDPSKRLAVINGISLTEGSLIEGVKVVGIYPTHVRFLHHDRSFEIPLGSSTEIR